MCARWGGGGSMGTGGSGCCTRVTGCARTDTGAQPLLMRVVQATYGVFHSFELAQQMQARGYLTPDLYDVAMAAGGA